MKHLITGGLILICTALTMNAFGDDVIKIGLIGLDTSHAPAFARLLNDKDDPYHFEGARVVCAYRGGSPDVEASRTRIDRFTATVRDQYAVEIVDSIETLLDKVDAVILTSVDGRVHLKQATPVIQAQIPLFIDKPLAASYSDAKAIFALTEQHNTPCFSSSSLRFFQDLKDVLADTSLGAITGCDVYSPCPIEPHHPDLFWYGIHGVELLFTVLGPDCQTVSRTFQPSTDIVVGTWNDGRMGVFRGLRQGKTGYGAVIYGENDIRMIQYKSGSLYVNLMKEIIAFFKSGIPPVSPNETMAIFRFMSAAQKSKEQKGEPIKITPTLPKW